MTMLRKRAEKGPLTTLNPEDEENRDQTIETEWFPIFREGTYPQGEYKRADVDEIADEFRITQRRAPMAFDHLSNEDMDPNSYSKPGPAVGYIIELRAVDEAEGSYKGKRLLEARAKVTHWASYETRSGEFRNVSVGLYRHKSHTDQKERLALHHLALLGKIPPGVEGLPEVIFSQSTSNVAIQKVFFREGNGKLEGHSALAENRNTNPREKTVDPISFSEHTAKLESVRSELALKHSEEVQGFKSQVTSLEGSVATFKAQLEETKTVLETFKAELPAKIETAKQEGLAEGKLAGKAEAEASFGAQREKDEVKAFCADLRQTGRANEVELAGDASKGKLPLADTILSIPAGSARDAFKELLSARPVVAASVSTGPQSLFRAPAPEGGVALSDEAREAQETAQARELVQQGKFTGFREAYSHVHNMGASSSQGGN